VFFEAWRDTVPDLTACQGSRIEGIGRPRVEPSFVGQVIDRMVKVPDAASLATIHAVEPLLGRRVGGSTGTNLWGAFQIVAELRAAGCPGSVVTLLCDGGERYANTYYDDAWLAAQNLDLAPYKETVEHFLSTGEWSSSAG
jgi:cysteine synthase A